METAKVLACLNLLSGVPTFGQIFDLFVDQFVLFVYFAHFFLRNFVFALHYLVLFEEPEQALEKLNLALALGKLFAFQKLNNLLRLNTRPWSIL